MNTRVHDPVAHTLGIYARRGINFVILSFLLFLFLWLGLLIGWFHYPMEEHWPMTRLAYENANPWASAVFWLCAAAGVLATTVAYLVIALWWRKRGGDLHHRGARFIDQRDGRN